MRIIKTAHDLHQTAAALGRSSGYGGILVPTMGALHAGHEALIRRARYLADTRTLTQGCIVSIFVNPSQFNDPADLARYPRMLDEDLERCSAAGAHAVFAPDTETIYPQGDALPPTALPDVATRPGLEDAHRPGHFAGVCQVVLRLFELLHPSAAIFGEKDWQQLQVILAATSAARLPIDIESCPTVRDECGLALSSRNRFLSDVERQQALAIPRALRIAGAEHSPHAAERAMRTLLGHTRLAVEYAVVRDAVSLGPVIHGRAARALIAARIGSIRLIDNAPWPDQDKSPIQAAKSDGRFS